MGIVAAACSNAGWLWCSSGSFPADVLFSGSLRMRPIAARAAMPVLHCASDRVTCAARARQRGVSAVERVWVARRGRTGAWERERERARSECGVSAVRVCTVELVTFRRDMRAMLITGCRTVVSRGQIIVATGASYEEVVRNSEIAGISDPILIKTPKVWMPLHV